MTTKLAMNIKKSRIKQGLTLEELGTKVGVSKATLQRYESGVISNIPSDRIELLADALGTTPACLMGWEEPKDNEQTVPHTVAAHHDGEWTQEELDEIEEFKKYIMSKRKNR